MIPTATESSTTQSNIDGHKIAMRFDEDSLVHLMSLLTEVYSDPELAVVREYATNAYDSHVEAGQTRPIEVETPSALKPVLIIRDFGVGLNELDIERVYSLYGKSTKRETNDQVGALGIGGKSALAYTSQFTVVGVKDGVRTVVSVSRDEDGAGTMTIVEAGDTDEQNGVEIMVPTQRHNSFDEKATDLFRYWPAGSVLLNGKEPDHYDGLKLNDEIMLVEKRGYYEKSVLVMGNIAYEIPQEIEPMRGLLNNRRVIARVPIGDVHFAPSREKLMLTSKTKARMEKLNSDAQAALAQSIRHDVEAATDKLDALRKAVGWRRTIDKNKATPDVAKTLDNLTYNGDEVPKSLQMPKQKNEKGEDYRPKIRVTDVHGHKLSDTSTLQYLEAVTALQSILVMGYTAETFTPSHKKKLIAYADQEAIEGNQYVLLNGTMPEGLDWFNLPIVKWDDAKAIKLERTYVEGARKALQGSYDVHNGSNYTQEKKADELEGDLYYYMTDTYKQHGYNSKEKENMAIRAMAELFAKYRKGAMLVRLGLNRRVKFLRDFPNAKEAKPELVKMYNELYDGLDEQHKMALHMKDEGVGILDELDADLIEDPMLKRAVEASKLNVDKIAQELRSFSGSRLELPIANSDGSDTYKLAEHYPLAAEISYLGGGRRGRDADKTRSHVYVYLNAAYEVQKELAALNQTNVQVALDKGREQE